MPALFNYHIFISHAWRYGADYNRLVNLLNSAPNFSYFNYSAPEDKPLVNLDLSDVKTKAEIKAAIERKINCTSCVLVISGMYTAYREWMQYEIDYAYNTNKPIIAVKPWGNQVMPFAVSSKATKIVGWNTDSIVSAIRECTN